MTKKKKDVTELKFYETPEWKQHSKMSAKLKKAKILDGPAISERTGTTLQEHLLKQELPLTAKIIAKYQEAEVLEDAQVKNVCNNAIIKGIIAIVIIRIIVYYFNH